MTNQVNQYERHMAIQEAYQIHDSDEYFKARPQLECDDRRKVFYAGHIRGYQAATKASESEINSLKERVAELEAWKNSAISVESEWDCQSVGKALNIQLGHSIRANILPKITALQADNLRLREALEGSKNVLEIAMTDRDGNKFVYLNTRSGSMLSALDTLDKCNKALSSTPTKSLAEHDNEVVAPYKKALEFAEYMAKSTEQFMIAINQLDEADQEEAEKAELVRAAHISAVKQCAEIVRDDDAMFRSKFFEKYDCMSVEQAILALLPTNESEVK